MKKILLALASVLVAGAVMAADTSTGGSLTFKTYYGAANNLKITTLPVEVVSTATGWSLALLSEAGAQVMGYQVGGDGSLKAVTADFSAETGYSAKGAAGGADWMLQGYEQGATAKFLVGAFKGASWDAATAKGTFGTYSAALGGNEVAPPVPAGSLGFGGAQVGVVVIPEPSILALGVLGLGAFLIRRRS